MLTSEAPDLLSVRYRGVKANVPLSRVYPAIVTRTFAMLGAIIADAGVCVSCLLEESVVGLSAFKWDRLLLLSVVLSPPPRLVIPASVLGWSRFCCRGGEVNP